MANTWRLNTRTSYHWLFCRIIALLIGLHNNDFYSLWYSEQGIVPTLQPPWWWGQVPGLWSLLPVASVTVMVSWYTTTVITKENRVRNDNTYLTFQQTSFIQILKLAIFVWLKLVSVINKVTANSWLSVLYIWYSLDMIQCHDRHLVPAQVLLH